MTIAYVTAEIEQLGTSTAQLYLCPANVTAQIVYANATNADTATNTGFTVTRTKSGESAQIKINNRIIAKGKSDPCEELWSMGLEAGDTVDALAENASDINLDIFVVERTV